MKQHVVGRLTLPAARFAVPPAPPVRRIAVSLDPQPLRTQIPFGVAVVVLPAIVLPTTRTIGYNV
jgi:hypothetical protein